MLLEKIHLRSKHFKVDVNSTRLEHVGIHCWAQKDTLDAKVKRKCFEYFDSEA
jgi:hypothetical protein